MITEIGSPEVETGYLRKEDGILDDSCVGARNNLPFSYSSFRMEDDMVNVAKLALFLFCLFPGAQLLDWFNCFLFLSSRF